MITLQRRQWVMVAALVLTLAAVAWVSQGDDGRAPGVVAAAAPRASSASPAARPTKASDSVVDGVAPDQLLRVIALRSIGNPFLASDVAPPPPPRRPAIVVAPPPPGPPPAPVAPKFPWSFVGRLIEDPQNPAVFLARGDNLTVARLGETLERVWKISGMDARELKVEYLPLKSSQTVMMQAANDVPSGGAGGVSGSLNSPSGFPLQQSPFPQPNQLPQGDLLPADGQPAAPAAPNGPAPMSAPVSGIDISNTIGNEVRPR